MNLYDIEKELYSDDVIFTFSGIVSYNFLTSTSMVIKKDLEASGESSKRMMNLFGITTEMFQNIMNYSAKRATIDNKTLGIGTCVIKRCENKEYLIISSGNIIFKKDEDKIRKRLDKIISLDKDSLKKFYKEQRRLGSDAHDNGAGLGFIEMAKKSDEKIKYIFDDVDQIHSYFELEVRI